MPSPCRIVKYKQRRTNKPIVPVRKPPSSLKSSNRYPHPRPPPLSPLSLSSTATSPPPFFCFGEGEQEDLHLPTPPPQKTTLERLREWVAKQRFIPQDLSDEFLTFFLSATSYSVDTAAEKLQKYFFSRQEPSYLFRNRDPLSPENVNTFKTVYVLPMPDTTDDGRKIILTGLVNPTTKYSPMEHAKALATVLDLLIWERDFGFGDFVIVFDGRGFECPQLLHHKLYQHKLIKTLILDSIPGTLRAFYFLYPPPHVAKVADTRDGIWINVVNNKQDMIAHLPSDILPLEYGGNLGHLGDLLEQWELHLLQSRDFFIHFEKRMVSDYQRRVCYEREVKERGKNWVQGMRLEAEEWESKVRYYERMRGMTPVRHPAFGSQRALMKAKVAEVKDPLSRCRQLAKREEEEEEVFQPPKLYNGYAKEIQEARKAAQREQQLDPCSAPAPILELQLHFS